MPAPIHHIIKHKEIPKLQKSAIADAYAERHPHNSIKIDQIADAYAD